ncbi:MerR family transcriptional regulator [Methanosphaerula subterraneus]|uniref:MerR family transcriptional regulator n=1 Tax=Methanosphaerula subterraneus TaxID=3350244 RepID=UPI003F83DA4A
MALDQIPIGKFSLITRLSQKALRLYDERGLLVPEEKDLCTGYRYYTNAQIPRGVSIKTLCGIGFPLNEIGMILSAKDLNDIALIRTLFEKRRREIRSEVQRLQQIEAILKETDASLEMMYMSMSEPVVKEVAQLRVMSKREKGGYAETISKLITELCAQLASPENQNAGVKITGPVFAMYHDCEYKEKDADIECVVPVAGRVVVNDPSTEVKNLPGGTFLSLIYKGSYPAIHDAWTRVYTYADERKFVIIGPGREIYLNDPATVPEEELLTEIQIPVKGVSLNE